MLVQQLWDLEFLQIGRPPRPLEDGSLFAAAITVVAEGRQELAAALAGIAQSERA
jgi:hypothetical protein